MPGTQPAPAPRQPVPAPRAKGTSLLERLQGAAWMRRLLGLSLVRLALKPARGDSSFNRFVRYSLVSGVAIVISQVTILVCTWLFHFSGILSNTIGALAATPASYELNRKWAWGKSGKSHLWREVVPFWALSLAGFLASTGTVQLADNVCHSDGIGGIERSLIIMGASLFAYGVIWIVKFAIFNRLFKVAEDGDDEPLESGSLVGPADLGHDHHHHGHRGAPPAPGTAVPPAPGATAPSAPGPGTPPASGPAASPSARPSPAASPGR